MKIKRIKLHNFISHKDSDIIIPDQKIIRITGMDLDRGTSNGAGKSTVLEAILFALRGSSRMSTKELVRRGCSSCSVTLEFEHNNKQFVVTRKGGRSSSLDVKIDGKELQVRTTTAKTNLLLEELGFTSKDEFTSYAILDTTHFQGISDLSSSDIKKLLQPLLNFKLLEDVIKELKAEKKSLEGMLQYWTQVNSFYYSPRKLQVLSEGVSKLERQLDLFTTERDKVEREILKITELNAKATSELNQARSSLTWLQSNRTCPFCKQEVKNLEALEARLSEKIKTLELELANYQPQLQQLTQQQQLVSNNVDLIQSKLFKTKSFLEKLTTSKNMHEQKQIARDKLERTSLFLQTVTQFYNFALQTLSTLVEETFNAYLVSLLPGLTCKLNFESSSLQKLFRFTKDGEECSFKTLSAGERTLVSIAFKLTLNMLNFKSVFLFSDEGCRTLDQANLQRVLEVLENSSFPQIFIIDHSKFEVPVATIHIEKKGGVSYVANYS